MIYSPTAASLMFDDVKMKIHLTTLTLHRYTLNIERTRHRFLLPKVRANYGRFMLEFPAALSWNSLGPNLHAFVPCTCLKYLKESLINPTL